MAAFLRLAGVLTLGAGILGATLPSTEAADYRGDRGNFVHRGIQTGSFGYRGAHEGRNRISSDLHFPVAGRSQDFRDGRSGFGHSWQWRDRDRFFANHPRRLQQLTSGNFYTQRGSGITILLNDRQTSNDDGASDSYATAAGTYSIGYGDYVGDHTAAPAAAPMAKIIDVATMRDACAYENGVCVIRP